MPGYNWSGYYSPVSVLGQRILRETVACLLFTMCKKIIGWELGCINLIMFCRFLDMWPVTLMCYFPWLPSSALTWKCHRNNINHWPLGDMATISKHLLWIKILSISYETDIKWMPWGHLMMPQNWFRQWLGNVRQQAITEPVLNRSRSPYGFTMHHRDN